MLSSGQATPVDYASDEKLREIARLKADELFPLECAELIEFIGIPTIANPRFKTSQADICWYHLKMILDDQQPKPAHIRRVKALITQTRKALIEAYERPEAKVSPILIRLERGTRHTGITLSFKRRKQKTVQAGPEPPPQSGDDAVQLWRRMFAAIEVDTIFLIYDTPEVGLEDRVMDRRGWWAGSGEVAASFLLGQCFAAVGRRVRVKRWRDMDHGDLTSPAECLIILGSSLNNPWLKRLRARERWVAHQTFHFEPPANDNSRGCIYKGTLLNKEDAGRQIYEHREAQHKEAEIDYALISFFQDATYRQSLIALQGITSAGTLAAVSFMCGNDSVRELKTFLLRNAGSDCDKELCSFEVVLQLHINDGLPADISIIDGIVYRA